jgi:hypothetical protein
LSSDLSFVVVTEQSDKAVKAKPDWPVSKIGPERERYVPKCVS